jgi:transcriptional regulator with XRE-family HTH domain
MGQQNMGESGGTMPTLQEARQERGWSPEELASRSGVPADVIAALEAGQREELDPDVIQALAGALELDASTVYELRPSLGLSAIGQTGSGEDAKTGSGEP